MSYNSTEQHQHDRVNTIAGVIVRSGAGCAGRAIDCGSDADDYSKAALAKRALHVTERRRTPRQCDSYGDQQQSI
jgi:hypothetical protein